VKRYTFVVQVHPGGISTLENLSTQERIRLPDVAAVGGQIEEWLTELPIDPEGPHSRSARRESAPGSAPADRLQPR
jgi:hypothetical protein